MHRDEGRPLTFESMLTDPLIRLMMQADGVTLSELLSVMDVAHQAVVARERMALSRACGAGITPERPV